MSDQNQGGVGSHALRRAAPVLVLVGVVAVLDIIDMWWLGHFRHGYPLDIDESGYMWITFHYADALRTGGLGGLWYAFTHQVSQAPLVPLAAVPVALLHQSSFTTLYVELGFFSLLVFASYGVARQFAKPLACTSCRRRSGDASWGDRLFADFHLRDSSRRHLHCRPVCVTTKSWS